MVTTRLGKLQTFPYLELRKYSYNIRLLVYSVIIWVARIIYMSTPEDFRKELENRSNVLRQQQARKAAQANQPQIDALQQAALEQIKQENLERQRELSILSDVWTTVPTIRTRLEILTEAVGGGDIIQIIPDQNTDKSVIQFMTPYKSRIGRVV